MTRGNDMLEGVRHGNTQEEEEKAAWHGMRNTVSGVQEKPQAIGGGLDITLTPWTWVCSSKERVLISIF